MLISDILQSGLPVQVDLLSELPSSNDPSTWQMVPWPGYRGQTSMAATNTANGIIAGSITALFAIPPDYSAAVAFGVSYQGQGILYGPFVPGPGQSGYAAAVIGFQVAGWAGP